MIILSLAHPLLVSEEKKIREKELFDLTDKERNTYVEALSPEMLPSPSDALLACLTK